MSRSAGQKKRLVDLVMRNAREALAREVLQLADTGRLLEGVAALFEMWTSRRNASKFTTTAISPGRTWWGAWWWRGPRGSARMPIASSIFVRPMSVRRLRHDARKEKRRFGKAIEEGRGPDTEDWPGLVLIDGGLGQLNAVRVVLEDLGIIDTLTLVSIAKGPDRNAGREKSLWSGAICFSVAD